MRYSFLLTLSFALPYYVIAFPQYGSLAGLSAIELAEVILTLQAPSDFPPPPGPLKDSSTKLVNDEEHPYIPPGPDDIRGPCPALNTLANHGYIPRNGVARPSEIVAGVQEGFNMGNNLAKAQVYGNHLLNGNLVTDLMSIGHKTSLTGPDCASCSVGGLNDHNTFEGDASMTRADFFFGDNHSFNETLFQEFIRVSATSGDGRYNRQVAADLRLQRFRDSIATNPNFDYSQTRYFQAFSEAAFTYSFFVDGRSGKDDAWRLDMETARSFFQFSRFPKDFHRAFHAIGNENHMDDLRYLFSVYPEIKPGRNNGTVNSFYALPTPSTEPCPGYQEYANFLAYVYPNPTGALLQGLRKNLEYFYTGFEPFNCTQIFPFGQ